MKGVAIASVYECIISTVKEQILKKLVAPFIVLKIDRVAECSWIMLPPEWTWSSFPACCQ